MVYDICKQLYDHLGSSDHVFTTTEMPWQLWYMAYASRYGHQNGRVPGVSKTDYNGIRHRNAIQGAAFYLFPFTVVEIERFRFKDEVQRGCRVNYNPLRHESVYSLTR